MRHAHHLFHSLQSLPSSQHPQRLPSFGYPSIYFLLVKLVKHFCWMLPSYLQWPCRTYLAFGGDKGTNLRIPLTRNGLMHETLYGLVVEVDVRQERVGMGFEGVGGNSKAMILGSDVGAVGAQVLDRVIAPVVTVQELIGRDSQGQAKQLMSPADA
jgi:hypothetical protein